MRQGLKEAQSKDAGRHTGTGSEVWYIRDEWARDHEVFHPHGGVLYKSGVYASTVTCLTPGGLSYADASRLRLMARLREEQSTLILWQESAEGIVGAIAGKASKALRKPKGGANRYADPQRIALKAQTVPRQVRG